MELLQKVTGQAKEAAELAVKLMGSCNRSKLQESNVISVEKALDMLMRSLFRLVIRRNSLVLHNLLDFFDISGNR